MMSFPQQMPLGLVPSRCDLKVGAILGLGSVLWMWAYSLENHSLYDSLDNLEGKE